MTSVEEVEDRLGSFPATSTLTPVDERALVELEPWTRHASRRRAPHRALRISVAVAAAVVAILLINIAAAYFAPKYQQAVADTPGLGPASQRLLSGVGLTEADVTVVSDSATSAGHTLKLVGG